MMYHGTLVLVRIAMKVVLRYLSMFSLYVSGHGAGDAASESAVGAGISEGGRGWVFQYESGMPACLCAACKTLVVSLGQLAA